MSEPKATTSRPSGAIATLLMRSGKAGQPSAAVGFLGQLGVAPFRARRLVMRVTAAQVIKVSECWMSRSYCPTRIVRPRAGWSCLPPTSARRWCASGRRRAALS